MNISQTNAIATEEYSAEEAKQTFHKVMIRLLPFLTFCYFISYLDRANISFAKLQFIRDLNFSDAAYGLGAGIFFIGYLGLEVPSNLLMQRIGARRTLMRIMILWGLISSAMMFVRTPTQFYVMRFLLGCAEGGFVPGIVFYLTFWFSSTHRGRAMGYFVAGPAIAGVVSGPVSAWIMVHMAGIFSIRGWQWMFLTEGIPTVILGFIAFFFLTDKPQEAAWMTDREKTIVLDSLAKEEKKLGRSGHGFRDALANPKVYVGIAMYFCILMPFNALGFWTPTIVKDFGVKDLITNGLICCIVFLCAAAGTYLFGFSSDRMKERRWHLTTSCILMAASFALLPRVAHSLPVAVAVLCVAAAASYGSFALFWTIPPVLVTGDSKASGIALISSLGLFGSFTSPTFLGWARTHFGSLYFGLALLSAIAVLGSLLGFFVIRPATKDAADTSAANRAKSASAGS